MEKLKIGITHGDMNGTSYEMILKVLEDNRLLDICIPIVYGSPKAAAYHRKALELNGTMNLIAQADEAGDKRPNIVNCSPEEPKVELGQPSEQAGQAAFEAIERATRDLKEEKIDAVVTLPVNGQVMPKGLFFGMTNHMEQIFARKDDALDMLLCDRARVAIATGDTPFGKVADKLTAEALTGKLLTLNRTLTRDFGIRKPRIAVLALNPDGQGKEEDETLRPAIQQAVAKGVVAIGPVAADQLFSADGEFLKYDAVMALYHDQGAPAFNMLAGNEGVRYTAGLSIVHTAPAVRLDYAAAGRNKTDENALRQAIYAAVDITARRRQADGQDNL